MKHLRDVLVVPEAARGLSIFGMDSFELLVEGSSEEYTRGILKSLKMKTTELKDPVQFVSRNGSKIIDEAQLKSARFGRYAV